MSIDGTNFSCPDRICSLVPLLRTAWHNRGCRPDKHSQPPVRSAAIRSRQCCTQSSSLESTGMCMTVRFFGEYRPACRTLTTISSHSALFGSNSAMSSAARSCVSVGCASLAGCETCSRRFVRIMGRLSTLRNWRTPKGCTGQQGVTSRWAGSATALYAFHRTRLRSIRRGRSVPSRSTAGLGVAH